MGGWTRGTKVKEIEEMDPDILLASDDLQDSLVDRLRDRSLEVRQFTPHTVDEVWESIMEIGELIGRKDQASALVSDLKEVLGGFHLDGRIYCEEWMDPPMVSGNWIPGLLENCGAEYFIEEGQRSREFSLKELKDFDPEYIFLNVCGAGETVEPEKVGERDSWRDIEAVRENRIYVVDDSLLNRPGPRLVEGVRKIESKME